MEVPIKVSGIANSSQQIKHVGRPNVYCFAPGRNNPTDFFMISWSRSLRPGGRDAWKRSPSEEAVMARLPCIPREVINTRTGTASQSASWQPPRASPDVTFTRAVGGGQWAVGNDDMSAYVVVPRTT